MINEVSGKTVTRINSRKHEITSEFSGSHNLTCRPIGADLTESGQQMGVSKAFLPLTSVAISYRGYM